MSIRAEVIEAHKQDLNGNMQMNRYVLYNYKEDRLFTIPFPKKRLVGKFVFATISAYAYAPQPLYSLCDCIYLGAL